MTKSPEDSQNEASKPADGRSEVKTVLRRNADGELHSATTVEAELPESVVTALREYDLQLKFHTPEIAKILRDQSADMVSTDGCISNPGGPSC